MKRLIISLGLAWALIYTANHTVFVRAASDTEAKVATSTKQVSTGRRIDSWGPYLPNVRPPLPDENPTVSPSQTRQPRQVAARQIETESASTADTSLAPKKESSDVGAKARGELSKKASIDGTESRSMLKKSPAASPKARKSPRPETAGPALAQASVPQRWEGARQGRGVGLFIFAPPGF
jgi:hypothetical protein